jgi:hypothetical protein
VVERTSDERTRNALLTSTGVHGRVKRVQYVDREEVDIDTQFNRGSHRKSIENFNPHNSPR